MTEEYDDIDTDGPIDEIAGDSDVAATHQGDPVAGVLLVVALSLIAVLLATTAAFFIFLQTLNHAPRTAVERDVATWEAQVAEKPTDANAWANLAYAYAEAKRFDDAVDAAKDGEKQADEPTMVLVQADVLRVAGRYQEAIEAYSKAETAVKAQLKRTAEERRKVGVISDLKDTSMLRVYFGRGVASHEIGDLDAAIKDLKRAAKLAPDQVNILVTLGDLYAEDGQTQAALKSYKAALKFVPDSPGAIAGLQRLEGGE